MAETRQARIFAALAALTLAAGAGLALAFPSAAVPLLVAGFAGYVLCGQRAMALWHADERVFDHSRRLHSRSDASARMLGAGVFLAALAAPALAQQTIFNVPSADVLELGKTYLEADALGRPQDPSYSVYTARGVYGFGANIEAGVNFGGIVAPGRSVPYATPNVKWQPWHDDTLAFTTGAFGLFYLRGAADGRPAALWYGEGSYTLPTGTRVTAGGYWASSGYAARDPQAGALVGFEQKVTDHLNVIADWISGDNAIGYFTPGISAPLGPWTIYLGYSLKNGNSKGNAILFELGFTF